METGREDEGEGWTGVSFPNPAHLSELFLRLRLIVSPPFPSSLLETAPDEPSEEEVLDLEGRVGSYFSSWESTPGMSMGETRAVSGSWTVIKLLETRRALAAIPGSIEGMF